MSTSREDVNTLVEPTLFPGGALSITTEALLDPEECSIVFVVRAFDVGAGKLIALWSSSPVSFDDYEVVARRAQREFSLLVREHSGPF